MNDARRTFGLTDRRARLWKTSWSPLRLQGTLWCWYPMWAQRPWSHAQKITNLRDFSRNVFDVVQSVDTNRPTWEGSYAVPLWDGNDSLRRLSVPMNAASFDRLMTWGVIHNFGATGAKKVWGHAGWAGNLGTALGFNTTYRGWEWSATNGWNDSPGPNAFGPKTADVVYLTACAGKTTADCFIRQNGVDVTTHRNPAPMTNRTGELIIGASASGEFWSGGFAEIGAVFNHTDQDLDQLERYLRTFYGF